MIILFFVFVSRYGKQIYTNILGTIKQIATILVKVIFFLFIYKYIFKNHQIFKKSISTNHVDAIHLQIHWIIKRVYSSKYFQALK